MTNVIRMTPPPGAIISVSPVHQPAEFLIARRRSHPLFLRMQTTVSLNHLTPPPGTLFLHGD